MAHLSEIISIVNNNMSTEAKLIPSSTLLSPRNARSVSEQGEKNKQNQSLCVMIPLNFWWEYSAIEMIFPQRLWLPVCLITLNSGINLGRT